MAHKNALTKNRRLSIAQKAAVLSCLVCLQRIDVREQRHARLCGRRDCATAWKAAKNRWRWQIRQTRRAVAAARATDQRDAEAQALLAADQAVEARLLWARALFRKNYDPEEGET
jgi:hypothetical protein